MKSINDISLNLKNYQEKVEIEAEGKLKKYRNKGKKMIEDTLKRLEVIKEDGAKFKVDLGPDTTAQEKYSMKIHEIVNSTIESIVEPEKIIKKSLNLFADGTRNALHKQDEMLIKYVSLLKEPSYKKKVKSLSNSLKRLNKDLTKLEKFIIQEYTANANIEDVTDVFDDILEVVNKFEKSYKSLEEKENEVIEKIKKL